MLDFYVLKKLKSGYEQLSKNDSLDAQSFLFGFVSLAVGTSKVPSPQTN